MLTTFPHLVFISELTCRAWLVAESQKRRTLQKTDVATAIAQSDMFDFLIDIVPRDDDDPGGAANLGNEDGEDGDADEEQGRFEEGDGEEEAEPREEGGMGS